MFKRDKEAIEENNNKKLARTYLKIMSKAKVLPKDSKEMFKIIRKYL